MTSRLGAGDDVTVNVIRGNGGEEKQSESVTSEHHLIRVK